MSIPRIPAEPKPTMTLPDDVRAPKPRSGLAAAWNGVAALSGAFALWMFACASWTLFNSQIDFVDKMPTAGIYAGAFAVSALIALGSRVLAVRI